MRSLVISRSTVKLHSWTVGVCMFGSTPPGLKIEQGWPCVGLQLGYAGSQVVRLRTRVAQLKHEVFGDLPFYRKAPFLDGGRVHVRFHSPRVEDRARLALRRAAIGLRGFASGTLANPRSPTEA